MLLNFGSMNVDNIFRTHRFIKPGETLAAKSLSVLPGGKGLNQSIAAARAGASVAHAGCVGEGGEWLCGLLSEAGVDITRIRKVACPQGSTSIEVTDDGENRILLFGGSNRQLTAEQIKDTFTTVPSNTIVLLQNEVNLLPELVAEARRRDLPVIFNPSPFEDSLRSLDLTPVRYLLVNALEAEQLSGSTDPEQAAHLLMKRYPSMAIVVTLGKEGSVCFSGTQVYHQQAFPVKAIDTTGAGDTFTGYFAAALEENQSLPAALRLASAASALAVTREGAASSVPMRSEVEAFLLEREQF